ncbi:transposase, partial [bacterium]|nr:transposase [bacterium]
MPNNGFEIVAICVLSDHIHLILNPENIKEYSKIISS